ncbi:MAG: hypothetical protein SynsKO_06730 [Synoicihabitans sp.]
MKIPGELLVVGLFPFVAVLAAAESALSDDALLASYYDDVAPIMDRYCVSCHGEEKQKGDLRFDVLDPTMASDHEVVMWESILDVLILHDMPPLEEDLQPSDDERQTIVDWVHASFERVAEQRRANRSSPMRRLTVSEYETTLRELFGTEVEFASDLPAAPLSAHGFSRDAALLVVSALELEYFLGIARSAVDDFVMFTDHIPDREHFIIEFEDVEYRPGVSGGYSVDEPLSEEELEEKRASRAAGPVVYSDRTLFPYPEGRLDLNSEELNRADRQKFPQQFARFKSNDLHHAGELIARLHVAAKLGDDGSAPRLRFKIPSTSGVEFGQPLVSEWDVTAPIDDPQIVEFRVLYRRVLPLEDEEDKGVRLTMQVTNSSRDPDAIYDMVPEGYNYGESHRGLMSRYRMTQADALVNKAAMREAGVNELYLDAAEIDIIPFGLDVTARLWRIDAQRANLNAGADSRIVAEESVHEFMTRAYRRTVSPAELETMMSLYDQFFSEGDSFRDALKETFSTVLISDPFLYVAAPIPLEDHPFISEEERSQLASRLSYFLWGGPPDDRLLELASRDQLSDPAILATEVDRMLRDDRARRFSAKFASEWLRLDKYGLVAVNPEFYPHYDEDLGNDLVAETITTFQEIFHGDRDARELIASDRVYINQRLARHYGFPAVTGGAFRPVPVPDYRKRGGLLHQGAILTMTADGAESNPIYRGVWILERLLHDPPPPPPPAVPALEASADDFALLTLKEKIELHREQESCRACHAKIDPWGLALEDFDAIGAWREEALVINPDTAAQTFSEIDSSTVLPDGEEIGDSEDLVSYLHRDREEEIMHSVVWHMMTYALAREPNLGDQTDMESIYHFFRTSGYKLSALVLAIVQSEAFQAGPDYPVLETNEILASNVHAGGNPDWKE